MKCGFWLLLLFWSCLSFGETKSPFDLITSPTTSLSPPESLSEEQVRSDLDVLKKVFSQIYGGAFYFSASKIAQMIGDFSRIQGPMKTQDFFVAVDKVLLSIPDSHSSAGLFAQGSSQMSPQRRAEIRWPQVGRNRISNASKVWEAFKVGPGKDIAFIAISSFPSSQDLVWDHFLETVRETLDETKGALIDLRGNSGGDDHYGMEMAKIFWGGPFHHPIEKQIVNSTPEALALFANHFRLRSISQGTAQDPFSVLEKIVQLTLEDLAKSLAGLIPNIQIHSKGGSDPQAQVTGLGYKRPILLLIDSMTASSGETIQSA